MGQALLDWYLLHRQDPFIEPPQLSENFNTCDDTSLASCQLLLHFSQKSNQGQLKAEGIVTTRHKNKPVSK